jgi:hypothetical protein
MPAIAPSASYRHLEGSRPVALVTLMKGEDVKKVTEKLD